jgi:hypothetical protein
MNALTWILFAGCCAACFAIGWIVRGHLYEVAAFRAWEERDAAWDRQHLGGSKLAPGADPKPERPSTPPAGWPS